MIMVMTGTESPVAFPEGFLFVLAKKKPLRLQREKRFWRDTHEMVRYHPRWLLLRAAYP